MCVGPQYAASCQPSGAQLLDICDIVLLCMYLQLELPLSNTGYVNVLCLTLVPAAHDNFVVLTDRMSLSSTFASQGHILNTVYTFMLVICRISIGMLFLQIKLLEAEIAYLRKQGMEDRDELSEYRQTAETVRYTLEKTITELQEEYSELDGKMKQVG